MPVLAICDCCAKQVELTIPGGSDGIVSESNRLILVPRVWIILDQIFVSSGQRKRRGIFCSHLCRNKILASQPVEVL